MQSPGSNLHGEYQLLIRFMYLSVAAAVVTIGLKMTTAASVFNLIVGMVLIRAGKKHRSVTLQADGQHLMTDVWTSLGVLVGIAAVWLTGWLWLDPVIALLVGANIVFTGYRLLRSSMSSLLSQSLREEDMTILNAVLNDFRREHGVSFPPARSVRSGRHRHLFVTMEAPGDWDVHTTHDLTDELEDVITTALPGAETFIHIEPLKGSAAR